ncbi:MAG: acyl-CoA/acyl-ACP dehydrogenase [Acidobacteriota bacterium]|nr:acyl-CoA/acyl-ACP dehydrogenase [Acidobacteriota bacterium]
MTAVDDARRVAEETLFPDADAIDAAASVPRRYLDALAEAGLYDLPADRLEAARIVEALGGASLVTAFVWIQHHSPVRAVAAAGGSLAAEWLEPLRSGRRRAGIAYAALRRPGPPPATAAPLITASHPSGDHPSGWLLSGHAPWVTGWGLVDVVMAGARCGDDMVWLLIDAIAGPGQQVTEVPLAALAASATVRLEWDRMEVGSGRVVGVEPYEDWRRRDMAGRATNGYLAVGVAHRCARLLGSGVLAAEVDEVREGLDRCTAGDVAERRATASLLAVRAASAVVAAGGGRSVEAGATAARLMREAMFLLVFGQSADIRDKQLAGLGYRRSAEGGTGAGVPVAGQESEPAARSAATAS